jgi:DNA modification methylase
MQIAKRYELVPLTKIVPRATNPRKHSAEQVAQIRASFREFGVLSPCLVDENYTLLAGHGRLLAAQAEGLAEINCVVVEGLTDAQKKAFVITDNQLTINSTWDTELLALEFGELKDLGFDLELTGFGVDEIEKLFNEKADVQDDDFDLTAALEEAAFVLPGDVWTLGRHRLLCGDATKAEDVARLMGGKKANLCVTDAPYNCDYTGGTGMKILNDKMKPEDFYAFLLAAFKNIYDSLTDGGAFYAFHSDAEKVNFYNATVVAGFHYSTTCIWVKDSLVLGRMDFNMRHEPVIYAFKDTAKHKFYGDRKQTTVWEFDRPKKSKLHPTMKPVELVAYPIGLSSAANGIVLDCFGGSGTTLIACEQSDRICYISEIDPKYASVILRRYVEFKGASSDVTCERGGEIFQYAELVKEVTRP